MPAGMTATMAVAAMTEFAVRARFFRAPMLSPAMKGNAMRKLVFLSIWVVAAGLAASASADTGVMGGWAEYPEYCPAVDAQAGISGANPAIILTPEVLYYTGGECVVSEFHKLFHDTFFTVTCEAGSAVQEVHFYARRSGPETIEVGPWQTDDELPGWLDVAKRRFFKCWDLPENWEGVTP